MSQSLRLTCLRRECGKVFESERVLAYCPDCVVLYQSHQRAAELSAHIIPNTFIGVDPAPGRDMPVSICVCGLCGSVDIEDHYGIRSGYGMGFYTLCHSCGAVLDFIDDREIDDIPSETGGLPGPAKPETPPTDPPCMENEL